MGAFALLIILIFPFSASAGWTEKSFIDDYETLFKGHKAAEAKRVQNYANLYLKLKESKEYIKCSESTYKNEDSSCRSFDFDLNNSRGMESDLAMNLILNTSTFNKRWHASLFEKMMQSSLELKTEMLKIETRFADKHSKEKMTLECQKKNKPYAICAIDAKYKQYAIEIPYLNEIKNKKIDRDIAEMRGVQIEKEGNCTNKQPKVFSYYDFLMDNIEIADRITEEQLAKEKEAKKLEDTDEYYKLQRGPYLKTNIFQLLITDPSGSRKICSATQVKINGKCSMLTNEHCVHDNTNPKITLITGTENEPVGIPSRNIDIGIKRADPNSELVLLDTPTYLDRQFCDRLLETKVQSTKELLGEHSNIVTAGYLKSGEVDLRYNYDTDDPSLKKKKPIARIIASGLRNIKDFVEFRYVDVGPGMSGGALLDDKGDVLGITTRYIPFQDTPWIIPISEVENFIDNKEVKIEKNPKLYSLSLYHASAKRYSIGDNIPNMPGDNIPNMPGDNVPNMPGDNIPNMPGDNIPNMPGDNVPNMPGDNIPNMPGDNIPNMPGDNIPNMPGDNIPNMPGDNIPNMPGDNVPNMPGSLLKKQKNKISVSAFSEGHEGIVDFNDPDKRKLVAVKCNAQSKWEQIDGNDDYIHKCDDVTKLSSNQKIYLDGDGFLPKTERLEVLKGFSGNYDYQKSDYFGREVVFTPNPRAIDGMQKVSSKIGKDSLQITADRISAKFVNKTDLDFKVSYTTDNKFVVLTKPDNTTLKCENKSLNKLICLNEKEVFSISMVNSKNNQLSYKYAIKEKNDQYHYYYGEFISK